MNDGSETTSQSFWSIGKVLAPTLIIGFLSYIYATLDNGRKDQLEFVRGQIVSLYGPLYTLSATSRHVWLTLGRRHLPEFDDVHHPPSNDKIMLWRRLLINVIDPLNDKIDDALLSSKQTISCPAVRNALHDFSSFSESIKLLMASWEKDNVSDRSKAANLPELRYPLSLPDLLCAELNALHKREKRLANGFLGLFDWHDEPDCAPTTKETNCH